MHVVAYTCNTRKTDDDSVWQGEVSRGHRHTHDGVDNIEQEKPDPRPGVLLTRGLPGR